MSASRITKWILPVALWGVVAMVATDAVILLRRHPVRATPHPVAEEIGLHADADGEATRVQWNRRSRPIRNADRAVLFIEDGPTKKQLDLTGRQLDGANVRYWPESELVNFRLEIYRGDHKSSDSTTFAPSSQERIRRKSPGQSRVIVEQVRPSPFERAEPEIVVTQTRPAPRAPSPAAVPVVPAAVQPERDSSLERVISKIPLLRRLRRHRDADGSGPHW